jgi:hypothetical protein
MGLTSFKTALQIASRGLEWPAPRMRHPVEAFLWVASGCNHASREGFDPVTLPIPFFFGTLPGCLALPSRLKSITQVPFMAHPYHMQQVY